MTKYILPIIAILLFSACSGGNSSGKYDDYQEDTASIEESPYDEGSGHDAGYQWASENGITDPDTCNGNSDSFIEGCKAYAQAYQSSEPIDAVDAAQMGEEMPYEDGR